MDCILFLPLGYVCVEMARRVTREMMKGWETIWRTMSTRNDGLYMKEEKESEDDNINMTCLYISRQC